jgi:hypothetical protein
MKTRILISLAAAALGFALPARAQTPGVDSRWAAFVGCWEPTDHVKSLVCIVPAGTGAVDLLTIKKGEVTAREHLAATAQRTELNQDDCTGWQTGEWSTTAVRVYLRSTETCAGAIRRDGTAIIAMTGEGKGEWVYIQGVKLGVGSEQTGVRVQRFRNVDADEVLLPDDVKAALAADLVSTMRARAAALAPLAVNDVVEASRAVDQAVVQAWLVERGRAFVIDAKKLVTLADAGVPTPVIDLIVALSYPKAFAINAAARQGERLGRSRNDTTYAATALAQCASLMPYWFDPYYDPYYDCTGRYSGYGYSGYGYGYGYGYPYDYGWSFGGPIIVYNPSGGGGGGGGGAPRPHGRVVNGQGYSGNSDGGSTAQPRSSQPASSTGSASSSGSSASSGSSSSSGSGDRTAHRRP